MGRRQRRGKLRATLERNPKIACSRSNALGGPSWLPIQLLAAAAAAGLHLRGVPLKPSLNLICPDIGNSAGN